MIDMYGIRNVLPDDTVSELKPGTSLLISGPAMSGKEELALALLAKGFETDDGVLCITTNDSAAEITDALTRLHPSFDRSHIGIVDCTGSEQQSIETATVHRVPHPGDLTGISIASVKILQSFSDQNITTVRHGLVSLSPLFRYLDLNTVFKFLHVYTNRINQTGAIGVFTVDSTAHDQEAIDTTTSVFDGLIEIRESESGQREMRIKGMANVPRTWHQY